MDTTRANEDAANRELVTAAVGDRCSSCDAPLASDQRYCVNCGERRGKPRFSFAGMAGQTQAPAPAPEPRRRARASASTTFVAGVGTLVLALGVGVLIGHNGNNPIQRASSPQVVTVAGGGANSASNSGAGSTGTAGQSSHKRSRHSSPAKTPQAKISTQTAHKAAAAAGKVLGAGAPPNPTVQPGQKSSGPGSQNGKFTGSFFGQ